MSFEERFTISLQMLIHYLSGWGLEFKEIYKWKVAIFTFLKLSVLYEMEVSIVTQNECVQ
jgi:hypothetical protein